MTRCYFLMFLMSNCGCIFAQNSLTVKRNNGDIVNKKTVVNNFDKNKKSIFPILATMVDSKNRCAYYYVSKTLDTSKVTINIKNYGERTAINLNDISVIFYEYKNNIYFAPLPPSAINDEFILPPNEGYFIASTTNFKERVNLVDINWYYYYGISYQDIASKKIYSMHKIYSISNPKNESEMTEVNREVFNNLKIKLKEKKLWL